MDAAVKTMDLNELSARKEKIEDNDSDDSAESLFNKTTDNIGAVKQENTSSTHQNALAQNATAMKSEELKNQANK